MSNPVRLGKVEEPKPILNKITLALHDAILRHPKLFLTLLLVLMVLLFFAIIFTITGGSAVESGVQYNHLKDVI